MWIKTFRGGLVNLNQYADLEIDADTGGRRETYYVRARANLMNEYFYKTIAIFQTEEAAQNLIDKLAEKLEAEEAQ